MNKVDQKNFESKKLYERLVPNLKNKLFIKIYSLTQDKSYRRLVDTGEAINIPNEATSITSNQQEIFRVRLIFRAGMNFRFHSIDDYHLSAESITQKPGIFRIPKQSEGV